jgi:NAD(P)-dependent dehydrogenase (short-subunit alcohol dehydrogenase family)
MALELARFDVRANAIAPGYVETEMTKEFFQTPLGQKVVAGIPTRRLGQVEDLDGPLLLLASDASRYMNGSVVLIDGGFLLA